MKPSFFCFFGKIVDIILKVGEVICSEKEGYTGEIFYKKNLLKCIDKVLKKRYNKKNIATCKFGNEIYCFSWENLQFVCIH